MNEFSNFVNGEVLPASFKTTTESSEQKSGFLSKDNSEKETEKDSDIPSFYLPFNPLGWTQIDEKTLSLNAQHYNGDDALMVHSKT